MYVLHSSQYATTSLILQVFGKQQGMPWVNSKIRVCQEFRNSWCERGKQKSLAHFDSVSNDGDVLKHTYWISTLFCLIVIIKSLIGILILTIECEKVPIR